jgi:hypothetical protein
MHAQRRAEMTIDRTLPLAIVACLLVTLLGSSGGVRAAAPGNGSFERTWSRTDKPVADRAVVRTWMWGPAAHTVSFTERYLEAPNGQRVVQYFDKSRMEITNPGGDRNSIWYVTNGLLVVELITGRMQVGDNAFEQRAPAQVNVAGDFDDPDGPTYATFGPLRAAAPLADGARVVQRVNRDGQVWQDDALAGYGVTAAHRVQVPGIDHQVASPFWAFMNSSGTVYDDGRTTHATLFENPFYATGLPITEAYWATVRVDGTPRDVLMQCFERRCLTYTPGNPIEWQVEAGNVGLHYVVWRYGAGWQPPVPTPPVTHGKAALFGVSGNAFTWEPGWDMYQRLAAESNVGHVRLEFPWWFIQKTRGAAFDFGLHDPLVDGYVAAGMRPFGMLGYSVNWASGGAPNAGGETMRPPTDLDAWENYVYQVVNHYKDRIHAWEVWNEPDVAHFWGGREGGDPVAYTELLKRAHRAIKRADPNAIVISAGVTGTERGANFIHMMLDHGAAAYMDRLGIHGYISDDGFAHTIYPDIIWPLIATARERTGKPLWVTEVGWNSGCTGYLAACSEPEQASRLIKNMVMLFTIGHVEMVSVFQLKDPGDRPNYFGIVQNNGTRRQAYTALQTLADRLTGLSYTGKIDRGNGVWAMRFSGLGRSVEVLWTTSGERVVTVDALGYPNAFVHDLDGNWQHQATSGSLDVRLTTTPILVELSN